ncbi:MULTISPECIES: HNH endonuclease [Paracoccus]|uniref:HNH endonuclease n=1 Tax=Paracoccus TaxID=265 RepID=UPI00086C5ECB|nr:MULTISPECIES: HNH endonuclease [Paracoccus]ODT57540.1 MAG: HNH endonuclease [Paracoccus sp. SCN 68-21]
MPARAPRICSCGKLVPVGAQCPCQIQRAAARKARFDKTRPNSSQRGYDREWAKARAAFLRQHPYCVACGAPASLVDHKTPHRGDQTIFWDKSRWQSLCTPCHSGAKQRLERRQHRNTPQ